MRGCGKREARIRIPEERTPTLETRFSKDARTVQPYPFPERASPLACENRVGTKRPEFASTAGQPAFRDRQRMATPPQRGAIPSLAPKLQPHGPREIPSRDRL